MPFAIKHEKFNGPLEILLNLIEEKKLFINDISLAKVADDFIAYVKSLGDFPLSESAQFILIASTLLLIKSKSLLPSLELSEDEKGNIADLERRLALYKMYREQSVSLKEIFGKKILFARNERKIQPVFSPDESMTLSNIAQSMMSVINQLPKKEFLPKVLVDKVMSLEEMISNLTTRVANALKMSFKDFTKDKGEKVNVIVSFLAMLELVKQGIINVVQERHFDDILMETENVGLPKY
ncbi:MAG TPA: ScpA family protein [Candidatus Paceibacterota bacterium]|nr:ScpA family protein [Candidatus Paceibacterota bacterium]